MQELGPGAEQVLESLLHFDPAQRYAYPHLITSLLFEIILNVIVIGARCMMHYIILSLHRCVLRLSKLSARRLFLLQLQAVLDARIRITRKPRRQQHRQSLLLRRLIISITTIAMGLVHWMTVSSCCSSVI